jgi:hypothetical protein
MSLVLKIIKMNKKLILVLLILATIKAYSQDKDTLFFKYDEKYIKPFPHDSNTYFLSNDGSTVSYGFGLTKEETYYNLRPKKIRDLNIYICAMDFYNKKTKTVNRDLLASYFSNYNVFFIKKTKKNIEYIKINSILIDE